MVPLLTLAFVQLMCVPGLIWLWIALPTSVSGFLQRTRSCCNVSDNTLTKSSHFDTLGFHLLQWNNFVTKKHSISGENSRHTYVDDAIPDNEITSRAIHENTIPRSNFTVRFGLHKKMYHAGRDNNILSLDIPYLPPAHPPRQRRSLLFYPSSFYPRRSSQWPRMPQTLNKEQGGRAHGCSHVHAPLFMFQYTPCGFVVSKKPFWICPESWIQRISHWFMLKHVPNR